MKPGSVPKLLLNTNDYTERSFEDNHNSNIQNESGIEVHFQTLFYIINNYTINNYDIYT